MPTLRLKMSRFRSKFAFLNMLWAWTGLVVGPFSKPCGLLLKKVERKTGLAAFLDWGSETRTKMAAKTTRWMNPVPITNVCFAGYGGACLSVFLGLKVVWFRRCSCSVMISAIPGRNTRTAPDLGCWGVGGKRTNGRKYGHINGWMTG